MKPLEKPNIEVPETTKDDPRLGHLLGAALKKESQTRVVIIGFPSDEGVRRNNGRPGAAKAPDEIRKMLFKMTPNARKFADFTNLIEHTNDIGNFPITGDVATDQQNMGSQISDYLAKGIIPIILGGGHETAFAHFSGYIQAGLETSIFNLDAHPDVRPLKDGQPHSGSPFRQAIEHKSGLCKQYSVAGLQSHSTAKAHLDFIDQNGGTYCFRNETNEEYISNLLNHSNHKRLMVTFDMDAVDQAFAPGVSAPCTNGLQPNIWLRAAYLAGLNRKVTSFDLSEVNPTYDRDGQTVELAALTIWHFLRGLSER